MIVSDLRNFRNMTNYPNIDGHPPPNYRHVEMLYEL